MNAPVFRLYRPVICIYASTDSTEKLPASTCGLPKSLMDLAKTIKRELNMPGALSGSVTEEKTFHLLAPSDREASSTEPSMLSSIPLRFRYASGNSASVWTITRLPKPYTLLLRMCMRFLVMMPLRPKSRIMAREITNGGDRMGIVAMKSKKRLPGISVRVTAKANTYPVSVDSAATVTPSSMELPSEWKKLVASMMWRMLLRSSCPCSLVSVATNSLTTGKMQKMISTARIATMHRSRPGCRTSIAASFLRWLRICLTA